MIIATDDPEVVAHLAEAVRSHLIACQNAGREVPPDFVRLGAWWTGAASRRQESPTSREVLAARPAGPDDASACLTYTAAAARLHVSTRTLQRLVGAGSVPAVRIGRSVRFRPSDLDAWRGPA